jgi:SAM-dependent methyltransferase
MTEKFAGPIQLSDITVKRDDSNNPVWEGDGAAHVRAKTGYRTSLGDSEHVAYIPYEKIAPGVEFSVWTNEKGREDGALIKIEAPSKVVTTNEIDEKRKCSTPVQEINAGVTTREIPYPGDFGTVFGLFVVDGKLFVYKFDQKSIFSPQQIKLAKKNAPKAKYILSDISDLKFSKESFDFITAFYSLIHLPIKEQPEILKKIFGLLKHGGYFLATVGYKKWIGKEDNWLSSGETMYWSHLGKEENLKMLEELGFKVVRKEIENDQVSVGSRHFVVLCFKP